MTSFHPMRWKKVASAHRWTKSSHRVRSAGVNPRTPIGSTADGRTDSAVALEFMRLPCTDNARRNPARRSLRHSHGAERFAPHLRAPHSCHTENLAVHPVPEEVLQQQPQPGGGALQVHVMTKARLRVHAAHAGLLGIELPWMEVKNRGLLVAEVHAPEQPAGYRIRHQAKVPSTSRRQVGAKQSRRGDRDLEHARMSHVRETSP